MSVMVVLTVVPLCTTGTCSAPVSAAAAGNAEILTVAT
jgi:hypothetical protein